MMYIHICIQSDTHVIKWLSYTCRTNQHGRKTVQLGLPGECNIFTNLLLTLTFSKAKYEISETLTVRALSYITDSFC